MLCFRCGSYNPENAPKCSVCGQGFIDEAGKAIGPPRRPSQTAQPASIFVPGETVAGRYKIAELLGQGGVGAVYRARDLEIDVDVALKAITANLLQTDEEQKNFSKQIKAARKLQHPNIVRIYDEGHEGNRRFFTMKLLEGLTLRKIIRLRHEKGQPFSAEELVPIFHQLAAALDYAHKSTWHGDLRPETIVVLPDVLKITDFHLVKALPLKPFLGIAKTKTKAFPYIAPELRVEAQNVDGRVDVYALGVILCEMLTGLVFEGHYSRAITAALEQLPTRVDGLVRKALSEHPDGRFARAGEMARELEAALEALPGPLPSPVRPAAPTILGQPAGAPAAAPAPPAVHPRPPPPPETGPSFEAYPGGPPPLDDAGEISEPPRETSDIVEIGQSQVVLLDGGVTQPPPPVISSSPTTGELAAAAVRLMAVSSGSNPEDTIDELPDSSDMDTAPRGAPLPKEIVVGPAALSAERAAVDGQGRPRSPEALVEALYADERDDNLIPPPLPDNEPPGDDRRVILSGDDDDDSDEQTVERQARSRAEAAPGAAGERGPPQVGSSEIHDAVTALKSHPEDLMDEGPRAALVAERARSQEASASSSRPRTGATASAVTMVPPAIPGTPPPVEDDDSLKDTLSADVLRAARERSSPSLHASEPLSPPVVAPPPVLRPVSPPLRSRTGPSPLLVALGIAALVIGVVVVGKLATGRGDDKDDRALVVPGKPDEAPLPVPAAPADAGAAAVADAGGAVVALVPELPKPDAPKPELPKPELPKPDAPKPDATAVDAPKPDGTAPEGPKPDAIAPDGPKPDATVALAEMSCPRGMALIPAGRFTFGSSSSDPMRNYGELAAAAVELGPYCIDYYEQPNGKDALPTTGVSWQAAKNACDQVGRRLCTEQEWERACKGTGSSRFPYGDLYDAEVCNTEDAEGKARGLAPASSFKKCRSGFKIFMMAGNAEEWVADASGAQRIAKGGAADRPDFASRCSARRALGARTSAPTLGFRCCAEPK